MRKLLVAALAFPAAARAEWPREVLAGGADGLTVRTMDLDGDGDRDVVSSSMGLDELVWFENLGGGALAGRRILASDAVDADVVRPADLDGDGDEDLVVVAHDPLVYLGEELRWYPNDGSALGAPVVLVAATKSTRLGVEAGDLDGDGDADLVVTTEYPGEVRWLANDGVGGFAPPVSLGVMARAEGSAIADLDADGVVDVLVSGSSAEVEMWYRGVGGGSFADGVLFATENAVGLAPADLDADGDLDVAMGTRFDACWKENLGGGDFGDPDTCHALAPATDNAEAIQAVDLDADGDLDLLTGGEYRATYWHPNESGTFPFALAVGDEVAYDVHAADITGDGLPDVLGVALAGGVELMENTAGGFGTGWELAGSANSGAVVLADVDGDGDQDIVTGTDGIAWWSNEGGAFTGAAPVTRQDVEPLELVAADLDGDGDPDLAGAMEGGGVDWYRNDGGDFAPGEELASGCHAAVLAADVDADGDQDLVCGGDELVWLENLGPGFGFSILYSVGTIDSVAVGDVDGDGDLDIVAVVVAEPDCDDYYDPYDDILDYYTCYSWRSLMWWPNVGPDDFEPPVHINNLGVDPAKVRAADLDGDGRDEMVVAVGHELIWFARVDDAFQRTESLNVSPNQLTDVHAVDLDGDGDQDLVTSGTYRGTMWYPNLGGAVFGPAELVAEAVESELAIGDLDGDYGLDVVAVAGDRLSWLANPTAGNAPPQDTDVPPDTDTPADSDVPADTDAPAADPQAEPKEGCGCATTSPSAAWLALVALAIRRRRSLLPS